MIEVNDDNFKEEVLESKTPVVVKFWAEWCGPCKAMNPILEEANDLYGENVKLVSVDIEQSPALVGKYKIRSIPTLLSFENGELRNSYTAAASDKSKILEYIKENAKI